MITRLFRRICRLCQQTTHNAYDLCTACEKELPWLQTACTVCALPLENIPHSHQPLYCSSCLHNKNDFTHTIATFRYEFPIDLMITQLKFGQHLGYASLLAHLLMPKLHQWYRTHPLPEAIIPVPLHPKRLRKRGFNQAIEIAKPLAREFKIPLDTIHSIRALHTQPQSDLPATQRKQNIRHAFQVTTPFPYRHIAIVDDVITTGCTVQAFAKTLAQAGVTHIEVWCCARTPSRE